MRKINTTFLPYVTSFGGLLSYEFLYNLRSEDPKIDYIDAEDFKAIGGSHPISKRELGEQITDTWNALLERWDAISLRYEKMDLSEARIKWILPLLEALGFDPRYNKQNITVGENEKLSFHLSHKGFDDPNAPYINCVTPSQKLDEAESGEDSENKRRHWRSPHDELQSFLNVTKGCKWGIATNGIGFRILRQFYHTTTKAYLEFDLENIFRSRSFSDFRLMYRTAHVSRFLLYEKKSEDKINQTCILEEFYEQSKEAGVSAGEDLRKNVKVAIESLANGFLTPDLTREMGENETLCRSYYAEILRVIYRMIFLLFAEQRGMLPTRGSLYAEEYSMNRLREIAIQSKGKDDHTDLWEGLKVTFKLLKQGCPDPRIGVFAYNGTLFDDLETPILSNLSCRNSDLCTAVHNLTSIERGNVSNRINYLDLGVEEIGSIYESLLDYTPRIAKVKQEVDGKTVFPSTFFLDPRGASRKTTGSYYTDPRLIDELIHSALEPVLKDRLSKATDKESALLLVKVCDPACGSGAFLIAANNFLARELVKIRRAKNLEPSEYEVRRARREVLQHCIHGVDVNPMAVELAKVSLWINASEDKVPLNFLDHHIKCGNSLIGATPKLVQKGIPDGAFRPVSDDDFQLSKKMEKLNRSFPDFTRIEDFVLEMRPNVRSQFLEITNLSERQVDEVELKKKKYVELLNLLEYQKQKLIADCWVSSFFWNLSKGSSLAPTTNTIHGIEKSGSDALESLQLREVKTLAKEHRFFHWYLEFPEIFNGGKGGFDCVIGNPPWDIVELNEDEFFSVYLAIDDFGARTKKEKKLLFENFLQKNPGLQRKFATEKKWIDKFNNFIRYAYDYQRVERNQGFPPKNNTYRLFIERFYNVTSEDGRCGMITPLGFQGDEGCIALKRDLLIPLTKLGPVYGFKEENDYFHVKQPFAVFTFEKNSKTENVTFFSNLHNFEETKISPSIPIDINLMTRMSSEYVFSQFSNQLDLSIHQKLYKHPRIEEIIEKQLLKLDFGSEEVNETRSSQYFCEDSNQIPLLKGDSIIAYLKPKIWRYIQSEYFADKVEKDHATYPRLVWGDIRNMNMAKRMCFTISPPMYAIGNSLNYLVVNDGNESILEYLCALLNSFVLEYRVRKISSNNHLNKRMIKDLPLNVDAIGSPIYFEITNTVNSLRLIENEELSDIYLDVSSKLNAMVAHLFSLTREEFEYLLETFTVLKRAETRRYGEFRSEKLSMKYFEELT